MRLIIKKKEKYNRNSKTFAFIWSFVAICLGLAFLNNYQVIAEENIYVRDIGKAGQIVSISIACIMAVVIIYSVTDFVCKAVKEQGKERDICLYAIPVLVLLLSYLFADLLGASTIKTYYVGDEKNIWDSAVAIYPFMFIYSSQLFLTCFFIFPTILAPSIVKICFVSYVVGYSIYRMRKHYHNYVFLLYLLFASSTFLEMGIRVHRMQWYGILYLLIAIKFYFDNKERKDIDLKQLIILSIGLSLLTIWRREGIYLIVWGLVMLLLVYGNKDWKHVKRKIIVVFMMAELFVCLPELIYEKTSASAFRDGDVVYQAFLVHMLDRPSFDRLKCAEELAAIDKYFDIEIIDRYNKECIEKYNDCYWMWSWYKGGVYYAPTENWSAEGLEVIKEEVISIVKKQPIVFLKSRIKAFGMAARTEGYNLFLPLIVTVIVMVWGVYNKERVIATLSLGMFGHTTLTALLMPASYFKYFFQLYLFGYVFGVILLFEYIALQGTAREWKANSCRGD